MKEYKGKCEWGATWIILGLIALIFTIYFCVLFGIGGRYGLAGGVVIAILVSVFLGGGCITVIISGISRMIYSKGKVVLVVFDDKIAFLRRNKFFNKDWEEVTYNHINTFSVSRYASKNNGGNTAVDKNAGTIEFKIGKSDKSVYIDIENCIEASELIMAHLDSRQIEGATRRKIKKS